MGSVRFKHNKKRDSGLIYEFLVRRMSESLIDGDSVGYKSALAIAKRYFSQGQVLDRERQLFEAIISTCGVKETVARGIIREVSSAAVKLDHRLIDIKKSNVIKEIHRTFGKEFFSSYRLSEYKAYASIQLLINGCNPNSTLTESIQRVQLEESLVAYMSMSEKGKVDESVGADPLVYRIAIKKFNERYNDTLTEGQKKLLSSYIVALASSNFDGEKQVRSLLKRERKRIIMEIASSSVIKEIREDKTMAGKLKLAETILREMDLDNAVSSHVEDMLVYCRLVEELKSDG